MVQRALCWTFLAWQAIRSSSLSSLSKTAGSSSTTFPVLFDSTNCLHRDLQYHPEQPARVTACVQALDDLRQQRQEEGKEENLLKLIDVATGTNAPIPVEGVKGEVIHQPFSDVELDHARNMLLAAHDTDLVTRFETRCNNSKQRRIEEGKPSLGHMGYLDSDTYVTTESFDVCLRATAAWIRAVDHVKDERNSEFPVAMALTRPPGHHATSRQSNGFCIYNFASAAALHALQKTDSSKRVSILDWDVHYGQGVADIVKDHKDIRYVSIHQTPLFPNLGEKCQVEGEHKNILTIPMPSETTWTCGYEDLFGKALNFVASPDGEWKPDIVIVCAGYDALGSDEVASTSLTAADFGKMTGRLWDHLATVSAHFDGDDPQNITPVMLGLEGGYQLGSMTGPSGNLPDAVVETVKSLMQ